MPVRPSLLSLLMLFLSLSLSILSKRIAIIGAGNWATTVARLLASNIEEREELRYDPEIRMWSIHEEFEGRNLTELINSHHENCKYLPGYVLSSNIIATEDIQYAVEDADVLCFIIPHQFAEAVLNQMEPFVQSNAICVSLTKGISIDQDGPQLISTMISRKLKLNRIAVLMGANIASDVAAENFVESTLACEDVEVAEELKQLFSTPNFRITLSSDVAGVELCGALKNIVALGVGFCDGMGVGMSTKAAIINQGLQEIIAFNRMFVPSAQVRTGIQLFSNDPSRKIPFSVHVEWLMWWRLHSVEGTDFVQLSSLDEELWERRYHW